MTDAKLTAADFERACSLLPEGVHWGESITPAMVLHIASAALESAAKATQEAATTNGKPASQYFRAGRGQGLQEAIYACKREHLEETAQTADDIAYTAAVNDCIKAIGRLLTASPAATDNGGGRDAEDARRYRWIRDVLRLDDVRWMNIANWNQANISAEVWDQEIDAALSQKAGEQQ